MFSAKTIALIITVSFASFLTRESFGQERVQFSTTAAGTNLVASKGNSDARYVRIYPNPFQDELNIRLPKNGFIEVYNILGELVTITKANSNLVTISLEIQRGFEKLLDAISKYNLSGFQRAICHPPTLRRTIHKGFWPGFHIR